MISTYARTNRSLTAQQALTLPALNPLMLNQMTFDVAIAGLGNASLQFPMQWQIGEDKADVTYSLPLGTDTMVADGTVAGQKFHEEWKFGNTLQITGQIGDVTEKLDISFAKEGQTWTVKGQVGDVDVQQTLQFKSKADKDVIDVDGSVGGQTLSQQVLAYRASSDGVSQNTMQGNLAGTPLDANATMHALKDRIDMQASGQNGTLSWSMHGQAIYIDPQPEPDPPA
jgi:hypothetical protein